MRQPLSGTGCVQEVSGMQGRVDQVPLPGLPRTGCLPAQPAPLDTPPEWAVAGLVPRSGRGAPEARPGHPVQVLAGPHLGVSRTQGTPPRPVASLRVPSPQGPTVAVWHTHSIQHELSLGRARNGRQLPKPLKSVGCLPCLFVWGDAPSAPRRAWWGRPVGLVTRAVFSQDGWPGSRWPCITPE